ncbi:Signal peptide peptidase-like 4 [Platanthera zijinensis]|uniref:Signal peptide peptidase-like 4 n=1 Tax=Platanthera zijinensis TaxID=2320716 RepID=A0AAP0BJ17_9ASPA
MPEVMADSNMDFYHYCIVFLRQKQKRESFMSMRQDRLLYLCVFRSGPYDKRCMIITAGHHASLFLSLYRPFALVFPVAPSFRPSASSRCCCSHSQRLASVNAMMDPAKPSPVLFILLLAAAIPVFVAGGDIVHEDDKAPKLPGCSNNFVLMAKPSTTEDKTEPDPDIASPGQSGYDPLPQYHTQLHFALCTRNT